MSTTEQQTGQDIGVHLVEKHGYTDWYTNSRTGNELYEQHQQLHSNPTDHAHPPGFGPDNPDLSTPEADGNSVVPSQTEAGDGLDQLGIVQLRQLGKGRGIFGMWTLAVPDLRRELRHRGIRAPGR